VSRDPQDMELALNKLAILDVVDFSIVRYWCVTHHKGKRLSPAAQAFKQYLYLLVEANELLHSTLNLKQPVSRYHIPQDAAKYWRRPYHRAVPGPDDYIPHTLNPALHEHHWKQNHHFPAGFCTHSALQNVSKPCLAFFSKHVQVYLFSPPFLLYFFIFFNDGTTSCPCQKSTQTGALSSCTLKIRFIFCIGICPKSAT